MMKKKINLRDKPQSLAKQLIILSHHHLPVKLRKKKKSNMTRQ
jgi:hypothetical protein